MDRFTCPSKSLCYCKALGIYLFIVYKAIDLKAIAEKYGGEDVCRVKHFLLGLHEMANT